jgi:hypothetical protein
MRTTILAAAVLAAALALAAPATASYPQGPPNDPEYDRAEEGGEETCFEESVTDEQHYLYDFMPRCARNAEDPTGAAGMSVNAAWSTHTTGTNDTLIAYVEGGINWHDGTIEELVDKVYINHGELPLPQGPDGIVDGDATPYDRNDDGRFSASDYAEDPRVHDAHGDLVDPNGNGLLDPEDLVVRFSDGVDDDGNGFTDDVSGWDFYNDGNNPATPDTTYDHANHQMEQAAAETNNGIDEAGVCPDCTVVPVKAGAEALDRTNELAQAWLFAGHTTGADVIVSGTADLGYSETMRDVIEHLWHHDGTVMVEASNDFDSTDHQGGMWWPHVLPGNAMVPDSEGNPFPPAANERLETFRARSGYTSWGTHNVFTVATGGGTTSEANPTVGGVLGMVLSYGKVAAEEGLVDEPLSGPEAIQVVRATVSDVDSSQRAWPANDGWDLQYGYGRPNVSAAVEAVEEGAIPPVASIDRPNWYEVYDPTETDEVPVTGHVDAARADGTYEWRLEAAAGPDPAEANFSTVASGERVQRLEGELGRLDLSRFPASFWERAHELSETKTLETTERYTVTLRLRAVDGEGRVGEDRRTISLRHDPSWKPGFPKDLGMGGESQPALADLDGDGDEEVVTADSNGRIHAYEGEGGGELPGWPATTGPAELHPALDRPDVEADHEPVLGPVAAGDIAGDDRPEVLAAGIQGHVYAYDADGELLPGWPVDVGRHAVDPGSPRPQLEYTRLPKAGASASPVLVDLDRDGGLEVLQASWDGHLYGLQPDGSDVDGWPVDVRLPDDHEPARDHVVVHDHKLPGTPAVADLDGDGDPEIVVRSQLSETLGAGLQPDGRNHVFAYHHDGSPVDGWPAELRAVVIFYGSAQEFITEGSNSPVAADVDGDGADEVATSAIFSPSSLIQGDGTVTPIYGPHPNGLAAAVAGQDPSGYATGNQPTDAPASFTTTGAFGKVGGTLAYSQGGTGASSIASSLLTPGKGNAIQNYQRTYDAASGTPLPGFPAELQGLDFLGAPLIVDVTGDGVAEVLEGGDSETLHAFQVGAGDQAPGWPKWTPGWTISSPTAGDVDGDGKVDVVTSTREGYVLAWGTDGEAGDLEWPTYKGDAQRTGRYAGNLPASVPAPASSQPSPPGAALLGALPLAVVAGAVVRRQARP